MKSQSQIFQNLVEILESGETSVEAVETLFYNLDLDIQYIFLVDHNLDPNSTPADILANYISPYTS